MAEKWISFDCYGTLLDWRKGFRDILRPIFGEHTEEIVDAYLVIEIIVQAEDPTASYKHVLTETLTRTASSFGYSLGEADRSALVQGWATIDYYPDTKDALHRLRSAGWKLAILTNCDDDLFEESRARLGIPVDLVITAQQVENYKPHLAHFLEFERQTRVERSRWVHAAVAWHHDMQPARDLGISRVWVDRQRTGEDASIVTAHIHDMASLPEAVSVISARQAIA